MSISLDPGFCIEALSRYGKPTIFNSDQGGACQEGSGDAKHRWKAGGGSQFTSAAFTAVLHRGKIAISMDGKDCWRSVKYEKVYLNAYASGPEARAGIGRYFAFYNAVGPRSALGGRTPDRVYFGQPLLAAA